MTAAISVELPPAEVASPYAAALLATCNIGMQPRATCVAAQERGPEKGDLAVAIVSWKSGDHLEARIQVGIRAAGAGQWQERAIGFAPRDPELERWRALGFAIATLVERAIGGASDVAAASPVEAAGTPPTAVPEHPLHEGREAGAQFFAGAGFVARSGVPGPSPALGGEVRLEEGIGTDRWFLSEALGATEQSLGVDQITLLRPRASLGGGFVLLRLGEAVRVAAVASFALEVVDASGRDPATGTSDRGDVWVGGLEEGADVAWMGWRSLGVHIGVSVREATQATDVLAHGAQVGRVPVVDGGLSVGVQADFRRAIA